MSGFLSFHAAYPEGDLKNKLRKGKFLNNTKAIGNSITGNHQDNRFESDFLKHRYDDDNIR